jgi:hypothetical protein
VRAYWILDAAFDARQSGLVKYDIDLLTRSVQQLEVFDTAFDYFTGQAGQVAALAGHEVIDYPDRVTLIDQSPGQIRPDKAGATSNECLQSPPLAGGLRR